MQTITADIQIFPVYGLINFYAAEHSPFPSFCHLKIHITQDVLIGETRSKNMIPSWESVFVCRLKALDDIKFVSVVSRTL